jgi:hypothetical protein
MGLFEDRFRRKFRREGGGYLFRHWQFDVPFSDAEVEAMVAQWRFYSANPFFWFGWVVLGVVAPLLLDRDTVPDGLFLGPVLAVTVNIAMVVLLVHGERLPNAEAEARVPAQATRTGRANAWALLPAFAFWGYVAAEHALDPAEFWPFRVFCAVALIWALWQGFGQVRDLLRAWQAKQAADRGR